MGRIHARDSPRSIGPHHRHVFLVIVSGRRKWNKQKKNKTREDFLLSPDVVGHERVTRNMNPHQAWSKGYSSWYRTTSTCLVLSSSFRKMILFQNEDGCHQRTDQHHKDGMKDRRKFSKHNNCLLWSRERGEEEDGNAGNTHFMSCRMFKRVFHSEQIGSSALLINPRVKTTWRRRSAGSTTLLFSGELGWWSCLRGFYAVSSMSLSFIHSVVLGSFLEDQRHRLSDHHQDSCSIWTISISQSRMLQIMLQFLQGINITGRDRGWERQHSEPKHGK